MFYVRETLPLVRHGRSHNSRVLSISVASIQSYYFLAARPAASHPHCCNTRSDCVAWLDYLRCGPKAHQRSSALRQPNRTFQHTLAAQYVRSAVQGGSPSDPSPKALSNARVRQRAAARRDPTKCSETWGTAGYVRRCPPKAPPCPPCPAAAARSRDLRRRDRRQGLAHRDRPHRRQHQGRQPEV